MNWLSLIISLPTENATLRQRAWRALKAHGAAVLRDGVYLLPQRQGCHSNLEAVASEVRDGGGTAHLLRVEEPEALDFKALFDRGDDFAALMTQVHELRKALSPRRAVDVLRQARKLRKAFASLVEIDFFPGQPQQQVESALRDLEQACTRALSPDEPQAHEGKVLVRQASDYRGRTWATRQRPWVDRLASAWLIRRFVDSKAKFLWLASPMDCPADALGFDFDGATFSHLGSRVTFEVLAASFALEQPAITRMGLLVHYLDVGGIQPPEATGIESVLAGMRQSLKNDDRLLASAMTVFDGLYTSYAQADQRKPNSDD